MNRIKVYILIVSFFSFSLAAAAPPCSAGELGAGSSAVHIYPNPTQGDFNVEIELDKNTEIEITIYNAIGKIIYMEKVNGTQGSPFRFEIPFENHPAGVYFVHVKAGTIKTVERLIKIK